MSFERLDFASVQDATLEEVDVHINQDAIAGLKELLEMQLEKTDN